MLAIRGGVPIRDTNKNPWPEWPVWNHDDHTRLSSILDSGVWSYSGPAESKCLELLQDYFDGAMPVLVANGTVSLQLALEALDIGYGDEVIVPGLTWQATASAVVDVNAIPILVDVDPETWCIDLHACEKAITKNTKAIIPVHLYGCIADMDALRTLAKKHHLYLIEDASHMHGAMWKNQKVGTIGDIGSFSLQMSKILTCGEGGILLTKNHNYWDRLEALRNCGRKRQNQITDATGGLYGEEGNFVHSGNYRITEFQAGLLVGQMTRLDNQNAVREKNALHLDSLLETCDGLQPMRRDAREVRRSFFNYAFRYDSKVTGISTSIFRQALSAELGMPFEASYQPLNDCSLYRPLTKKRHMLSLEYIKKLNPLRFELPVCKDVYSHSSVVFHHKFLLGSIEDMDLIFQACEKILDHKNELD
ncbi:DegT/DnrJ/EryC1/StrS family aminotransferase [Pleomorphochaeta sp. DL1XJH-081]|uniref:DegT/DnrJ/EryC1/StrS family aminotransferase n=1 Tax=Pleomorphochaeta sp. DL1XJH-081 TaxID=3409690 RepID=UPI003BB74C49